MIASTLKLTLVITLAVIDGSIVSNDIAGALFVIELHIAVKNTFDLIQAAALTNFEVHEELFLGPAVQRLVDGVVRRFTGAGHGPDDVGIVDQIIIGHRGICRVKFDVEFYSSIGYTEFGKELSMMPNIKPISDLRNYSEVLNDVAVGAPVFLTKNGRGRYAIVDIHDYEKSQATLKLLSELEKGRISGETEGWLSPEEVRAHFRARAKEG